MAKSGEYRQARHDKAENSRGAKRQGSERVLGPRVEAKNREEEARVWISGIEAVKAKIGVKAIYDLSATPFFPRGSGYPEGTLFPWVVSDFFQISLEIVQNWFECFGSA